MLVKQVMTPNVITVFDYDFYEDAVKKLVSNNISGMPVLNRANKVVGIVSEKDLIRPLFPSPEEFYKDPDYFMDPKVLAERAERAKKLRIKDLMSKRIVTIPADNDVLSACAMLIYDKIRRLPVVENGTLVGIVTTKDLFKEYLHKVVK